MKGFESLELFIEIADKGPHRLMVSSMRSRHKAFPVTVLKFYMYRNMCRQNLDERWECRAVGIIVETFLGINSMCSKNQKVFPDGEFCQYYTTSMNFNCL